MYEENSHRLVYGSDCRIQNETANHILDKICEIAEDTDQDLFARCYAAESIGAMEKAES